MFAYVCAYVRVCTRLSVYVCAYASFCARVSVYLRVCQCMCMCVSVCACVHVSVLLMSSLYLTVFVYKVVPLSVSLLNHLIYHHLTNQEVIAFSKQPQGIVFSILLSSFSSSLQS